MPSRPRKPKIRSTQASGPRTTRVVLIETFRSYADNRLYEMCQKSVYFEKNNFFREFWHTHRCAHSCHQWADGDSRSSHARYAPPNSGQGKWYHAALCCCFCQSHIARIHAGRSVVGKAARSITTPDHLERPGDPSRSPTTERPVWILAFISQRRAQGISWVKTTIWWIGEVVNGGTILLCVKEPRKSSQAYSLKNLCSMGVTLFPQPRRNNIAVSPKNLNTFMSVFVEWLGFMVDESITWVVKWLELGGFPCGCSTFLSVCQCF